jgi:hypothetical protein
MVGHGDAVIGENRRREPCGLRGNAVDVKAAVVLDRRGKLFQVRSHSSGVESCRRRPPRSAVPWTIRGSASPTLRIVDGERGLVEIALELKSGLLDKLLVFRLARNRRQLAGGVEGANPFQVDVEETVGAGEQAGGFRRSLLAQEHDQRDAGCDQQNGQGNEEMASNAHRIWQYCAHPLDLG